MAAISITAANVVPDDDKNFFWGIAGATITAGQVVYYDSSTATYKLTDSDVLATSKAAGIAACGASTGQPFLIYDKGTLTIGGTVAAGVTYVVSQTAGGISPLADLLTGDYLYVLGYGTSATKIKLDLQTGDPILVA